MTNKTIGEYTETTTPSATDKVLLDIGSGVYKYAQLSKLLSVIPFTTSGKIETTNTSADSIKTAGGITIGNGLKFPSTQASSADANTLDDYEEGTWTPNFSAGYNTSGVHTYSTNIGHYTKIGRMVVCSFKTVVSANNGEGGTGTLVTGLPYTPMSGNFFSGSLSLSGVNLPADCGGLSIQWNLMPNANSYLMLVCSIDNAVLYLLSPSALVVNSKIQGTFTYFTD